jgi:2-succinyl-5-enolpyruvyl-6-hydroxy-3-cyclohexene-1-carboxylate synthase
MANRNTLWSEIFVDELSRSGLKAVCAAPGSRHTPLMLAFARHPDIKVYSHLDERSASFFALGLALASDTPVALICTSGTAGANMYPAIIEAHQSRVPLIVITADRPAELRHSGANQTIDQIKMFGDFVLWFVDMALPEANPPALAIRNLRTTANRAYAKANGIRKGVVHINMPFRKPLEPITVEGDMQEIALNAQGRKDGKPFTLIEDVSESDLFASSEQLDRLFQIIDESRRGIIVCGPRCQIGLQGNIGNLSDCTDFPILIDPVSGIQRRDEYWDMEVAGYDTFLRFAELEDPDLVIYFGAEPTSANLQTYLEKINPKHRVYISESGDWTESSHLIDTFIWSSPKSICFHLTERIKRVIEVDGVYSRYADAEWTKKWDTLEKSTWQIMRQELGNGAYFDGAAVYDVVDLIPDGSTLFAGNSLPVRHLDQFGRPTTKRIYTYANRGASGIDGNISSALGAGAARPDKPLVAVVGDITFYHDMNGLLAVHRCGIPVTIVLLNNDGGGIFNRLPIKNFEPEFTDYFLTPHGLDFSHAAKMYGLDYILVDAYSDGAREAFRQAFSERVGSGQSTIIEVRTDSRKDEARRQGIVTAVHARLQELNLP